MAQKGVFPFDWTSCKKEKSWIEFFEDYIFSAISILEKKLL